MKTRSISRETATAMFLFNDISTLLSPFHGLTFIFKHLPQAKAWGYLLLPLRGEIRKLVVPLNLVAIPIFDTSGQAPWWQIEIKSTPLVAPLTVILPWVILFHEIFRETQQAQKRFKKFCR